MKIWSDEKCSQNFVCHMMLPFWSYEKNKTDPDSSRFDKYIEEGKSFFNLVDFDEADFVIYPKEPFGKDFLEFQEKTKPKKMILFFNNDSDEILNYRENTYVFRTSFYKKTQKDNEFAIPGWSADNGAFNLREWKDKPTVSFCGQLDSFGSRGSGIKVLEKNNNIIMNCIIRNQFWGGALNTNNIFKVRQEFLNNMENGDYVLCGRGGGNFSYRIYEAMSNGRIPILVNTDCVLPYDFLIKWENIFPIIDLKNIDKLPEVLLNFHNSVKDSFGERQILIRQLYEEYISPVGFFKNFYKHFGDKK